MVLSAISQVKLVNFGETVQVSHGDSISQRVTLR